MAERGSRGRHATTCHGMRKLFFVDLQMCGGDSLPAGFDLEEFCERLQGKVPEVEVVPIVDPGEAASNLDPELISDSVFYETLGEYCQRQVP
jgi:hypothetical protein